MPKKQQKFADDGWAIWIDGEDTSTVYINDWLNPKGKSYVDLAVRIRGVKQSKNLHVYVPFSVSQEEIQDISLMFNDTNILQATFSATCIVEYKKNNRGFLGDYNDKLTLEMEDELSESTYHYLDSIIKSGNTKWFKHDDEYSYSIMWGNGLPAPKGEREDDDGMFSLSFKKGSKIINLSHGSW